MPPNSPTAALKPRARERVLAAAYELITVRGVRGVGIDEIVTVSGVAKATLYRHFSTKDDLVLAVLERREALWTYDYIERQSRLRGTTPEARILAIFDVFDEWFRGDAPFEACSFINVLLEMGPEHRAGRASIMHLTNIRTMIRERAEHADLRDCDEFAASLHILMKGSIISAAEGDRGAARRAQQMARALIERHRQPVGAV